MYSTYFTVLFGYKLARSFAFENWWHKQFDMWADEMEAIDLLCNGWADEFVQSDYEDADYFFDIKISELVEHGVDYYFEGKEKENEH